MLTSNNSSHIDTTAIQALIDARTEIERWTDYPVEVRLTPLTSLILMLILFAIVPFRHYSLTLDPSGFGCWRVWLWKHTLKSSQRGRCCGTLPWGKAT